MSHGVWVTGATGAIGSHLCRRLADAGYFVLMSARDAQGLEDLAASLHGKGFVMPVDTVDREAVDAALANTVLPGPLTGMAHCVGSILVKPLHATSESELEAVMRQNFTSAWNVLHAFVRHAMAHRRPSSAVLVGSVAGSTGFPNHEAVASAKAAVAGLARSSAATYAPRQIRVNCVEPGLIRSRMTDIGHARADTFPAIIPQRLNRAAENRGGFGLP